MELFVDLDDLVNKNHVYRKFTSLINFDKLASDHLFSIDNEGCVGRCGYGVKKLFKVLFLQFLEDLSDRELEKFLSENVAAKWFCNFSLKDKTPDHTIFTKFRSKVGTSNLSKIFSDVRSQLKSAGYVSEIFTFVDATSIISKASLWKERDRAIANKLEKLNNQTISEVAPDKDAKFGCKGKDKMWYGFKKHVSVDMQSGMINKVAITSANIIDSKGFKHVAPSQGAVYADKGYCDKNAKETAQIKNLHLAAVKKNNMKDKNRDLDRWYSKIRSPYERVFSNQNKRAKYKGLVKNQFHAFMHAITFNLKRLVVLTSSMDAPLISP